jgi:hypothetical protein
MDRITLYGSPPQFELQAMPRCAARLPFAAR